MIHYFSDYIACHQIDAEEMKTIIQGVVNCCKQASCSLIGGEMAEMNVMYKKTTLILQDFVGLLIKQL